ncbi:MAG: hypothetical protein K0S24_1175 [Sphingobacterium sp.]|jgi:hypothetical protein|nr:hypothetical protein [Sphingobacterium sp.]
MDISAYEANRLMYLSLTKIGKKEANEIAVISYFLNDEQICSNFNN